MPQFTDERAHSPRRIRAAHLLTAALLALPAAPAALAQTGPRLLVEPFPKEQLLDVRAEALFFEGGYTKETGEDFDLRSYRTEGRFRLDPGNIASPRIGYEFLYLDTESDLLPERLGDYSVGVGFPIGQYEDWIFALSLGIGYAGDGGFEDGDAWYGQGTALAFKQIDEHSGLVFLIDYDRNRSYYPDIPLPGVAYTRVLSDQLEIVVGVPVSSLRWKPVERLEVGLNYLLPDRLEASVTYEVADHLSVFGRVRNVSEAFFLDDLESNHDRLLFEQRRAEVGLQWEPRDGFQFQAAVGYAWGGEFSVGFDQRDSDEVTEISDEPYVRAGLEIRF